MKKVFVIQPDSPEFEDIYDLVRHAILKAGATPYRLGVFDMITGAIVEELYKIIETADVIICDVSHSNPNVMYELGYAHALKKPVILISRSLTDVASDIVALQLLRYDLFSISGETEFAHELENVITEALKSPETFAQRTQIETKTNSVVISYSHGDQDFLRRMMVHLRPLEKKGQIDLWVDTKLSAGDEWQKEIEKALANAKVAILMVSADFLASDFIVENELPPLLEKAEMKGTRIVPVILKPCRFTRDKNLARFQAINDPARPLIVLSEGEREEIYDKVASIVERSIPR